MARAALLPFFVFATFACAEAAAPDESGCSAASDCPAGQQCGPSGRCVLADGGGGAGGGVPVVDACRTSADCHDGPFTLIEDVYWDGGGADLVCVVPPGGCPQGGCRGVTACAEASGERDGLFRCEEDADCASGRCLVPEGGVGLCFRACGTDEDCPKTGLQSPRTVGFGCRAIDVRGVELRACLPLDPARPEATLCRRDEDCGPTDAGLACRLRGKTISQLDAIPLCEAAAPAPTPTLSRCAIEPETEDPSPETAAACGGGACVEPCHGSLSGGLRVDVCLGPNFVCSGPCGTAADCPPRMLCSTADDQERVGGFIDIPDAQVGRAEGRELRLCLLPARGCLDERDCCPSVDAGGLCVGGWGQDRTRCLVEPLEEGSATRLMTVCAPIDPALAAPGACCDGHDACDSKLCVPARAGSACAGRGVCSSPCGPDLGADGLAASGDELERCADPYGPGDYHAASRCRPFSYERRYVGADGAERTLAAPIDACQ